MTHPFASAIAYPWTRPEAGRLYDLLARDITNVKQIDILIKKASADLPQLNLNQAPGEVWKDGLEDIARAGALLALCRVLVGLANVPDVSAAAQVMLDARSVVEKRIMPQGRITVDREALRRRLAQLAAQDDGPDAIKVLLVRGGRRTGKTWSRHLFERAAHEQGAKMTYIYQGMVASVGGLIDKLFSTLDASDRKPPPDETSPEAWYDQVCYRLPEAAERFGRPLWIAMDDLGPGPDGKTPLLDPEIRTFFDQFALHLLDPAVHRWFRLLLIHYPDGPVPTRWDEELWQEDRTREEDIEEADIEAVIHEWLTDHDRKLPEEEVQHLAAEVFANADAPLPPGHPYCDAPRLRRIHKELVARLRDLGGQPP